MDQFNIVSQVSELFVPNDKVRYYILNKFRKKFGLDEVAEFDEVGEYHWKLSKIFFNKSNNIGYMPNAIYYDNMIEIDFVNNEIIGVPKNSVIFFREKDQAGCYKKLVKLVYAANTLLSKYSKLES